MNDASSTPTPAARIDPLVEPGSRLTARERERYARHLLLPGIGEEGQRRLKNAKVLVIGAGGLGSPSLLYLAAAGVGSIGVVDDDVVDLSNLQRQIIHGAADVGRPKVDSAVEAIARVNPLVTVVPHHVRLTTANALEIIGGYDLVLDGADNFATRYLVADACELLATPCVWGSLLRFDGQVSVFWPGRGPVYRDIFPDPPDPSLVPSCAEAGVFGVLCAAIGAAMSTEAVKLITGTGRPLIGRLLVHDALGATWRELAVRPDPGRKPVTELTDVALTCGVPEPDRATVTAEELSRMLRRRRAGAQQFVLIDVREDAERDLSLIDGSEHLRKGDIIDGTVQVPREEPIVVHCASGVRSAQVLDFLVAQGYSNVSHLEGGIDAWSRLNPVTQS